MREFRCPEIRTRASLGYGFYEARIRQAKGSGLNTAMFTYSGPPLTPVHDELDFELLGRDPTRIHTNYFVAGDGQNVRLIGTGADASANFHNYAIEWRPGLVRWYIDGRPIRTASTGSLPRTPGQFFLSLWGGSPEWMGQLDRSAVPAVAAIDWVAYTPAGRACLFPQSVTCAPKP